MTCKFRNSGQTCISANRILVQDRDLRRGSSPASSTPRRSSRSATASRRTRTSGRSSSSPRSTRWSATSAMRSSAAASCCSAARASAGSSGSRRYWPASPPTRRCRVRRRSARSPRWRGSRPRTRRCAPRTTRRTGSRRTTTRATWRASGRLSTALRVRHPRDQHRLHLVRGRAVRRPQGVGHRPRGLEVRDRRVARDQVPVHGRRVVPLRAVPSRQHNPEEHS